MKDRGIIKWNGFFMPEHIAMLKRYKIEYMMEQKPVLDDFEIQEINDVLVNSIMNEEPIKLKLWLDGFIEYIEPFVVTKIDPHKRILYGIYKDSTQSFSFDSIIGANRI